MKDILDDVNTIIREKNKENKGLIQPIKMPFPPKELFVAEPPPNERLKDTIISLVRLLGELYGEL